MWSTFNTSSPLLWKGPFVFRQTLRCDIDLIKIVPKLLLSLADKCHNTIEINWISIIAKRLKR